MPELPDVLLYIESLRPRILNQPLERVRLASPFVVRSVAPPTSQIHGHTVQALSRLGKQIVWQFEGDLFLVIHHRARLSPMKLTSRLTEDEIARLYEAVKSTLKEWIERLRTETGSDFPSKVTAFRPEMAVHGRYGQPCPVCGSPVQRIVYAENECNYCATCQTEGRLLADRALSRLLKRDWPRSLDEWDAHLEQRRH